jgi:hypothetical protein
MILLPWRWQALNLKIIYRNKLMIFFTSEVFLNSGFGSWLCSFIAIVTRFLSFFMRFHENWTINYNSFLLGLWFQPSLLDSLMKQHIWPAESANNNLFILLHLLHLVAKSFELGRLECLWGCVLQLALLGIQLESFPNVKILVYCFVVGIYATNSTFIASILLSQM